MNKFFLQKKTKKLKPNTKIRKTHIGKIYIINNGNSDVSIRVLDSMVGHNFGEFYFTKRLGSTIHKKKRKKKLAKKK